MLLYLSANLLNIQFSATHIIHYRGALIGLQSQAGNQGGWNVKLGAI